MTAYGLLNDRCHSSRTQPEPVRDGKKWFENNHLRTIKYLVDSGQAFQDRPGLLLFGDPEIRAAIGR